MCKLNKSGFKFQDRMKPWCATIKMKGVKKFYCTMFFKIIQKEIQYFTNFELGTLSNGRVKEERKYMSFSARIIKFTAGLIFSQLTK